MRTALFAAFLLALGGCSYGAILSGQQCQQVQVLTGKVPVCLNAYYDLCNMTLSADVTVSNVPVTSQLSVQLGGAPVCATIATGCSVCFQLTSGELASSGFSGCFVTTLQCGISAPLQDLCISLGEPYLCNYTRCDDCVTSPNCGWCHATHKCMAGDNFGPRCATCAGANNTCMWFYDGCPSEDGTCPYCPLPNPNPPPPAPPGGGPTTSTCTAAPPSTSWCASYVGYSVLFQQGQTYDMLDYMAQSYYPSLLPTDDCVSDTQVNAAKNLSCLIVYRPCQMPNTSTPLCSGVCYALRTAINARPALVPCPGASDVCQLTGAFSTDMVACTQLSGAAQDVGQSVVPPLPEGIQEVDAFSPAVAVEIFVLLLLFLIFTVWRCCKYRKAINRGKEMDLVNERAEAARARENINGDMADARPVATVEEESSSSDLQVNTSTTSRRAKTAPQPQPISKPEDNKGKRDDKKDRDGAEKKESKRKSTAFEDDTRT